MAQNSLIFVVEKLLQKNRITFDKKELSFQIQSHPSYPSLHSITGVLDHFNIENIAADVPVNKETLDHLPDTFIAQLNIDGINELAAITKKKAQFLIHSSGKKPHALGIDQFLEKFTGIVVAVEKDEVSKPTKNNAWLTNMLWYTTAALCLILLVLSRPTLDLTLFLALSIIGVVISIVIVKQESGLQTTLGNAFCSSNTEKKDCDAVLTSDGAKVFGKYKISDFGSVYFISLTLISFFLSVQHSASDYLFFLSFLALPITLYSIYYQLMVIKKWCLLCLSIIAILWLQASVSFLALDNSPYFDLQNLLTIGLTFLSVFMIWNYLKSKTTQLSEAEKNKIDFFKFKRNFDLFSTLLNQSPALDTEISNRDEISFGNEASETTITIITNPFCGHCKPIHILVESILDKYRNDIRILIRFNVHVSDDNSEVVKITTRLLEIYHNEGKAVCLEAMSEIYGGLASKDWLIKWEACKDKVAHIKVLEEEKQWCTTNQINFTPELLINGRAFPKAYERADLIYFIEDLSEASGSTGVAETPEEFELAL